MQLFSVFLSVERIFQRNHFFASHVSAKSSLNYGIIRQQLSALYFKDNITFCPILRFQEMNLPENPYLSPHIHFLHEVYTACVRKIIKDSLRV